VFARVTSAFLIAYCPINTLDKTLEKGAAEKTESTLSLLLLNPCNRSLP